MDNFHLANLFLDLTDASVDSDTIVGAAPAAP